MDIFVLKNKKEVNVASYDEEWLVAIQGRLMNNKSLLLRCLTERLLRIYLLYVSVEFWFFNTLCIVYVYFAENAFKDYNTHFAYAGVAYYDYFIAFSLQYLVPMGLNQLGSVLYFLTLQHADISLTVPVTNSLTFVFTAVSGRLLGEKPASKCTYFGMVFILLGTALCCYDKYLSSNKHSII